jgi:protease I
MDSGSCSGGDACIGEPDKEEVFSMTKRLLGMRVAVLAADGFEQIELTRPAKALEKEGAVVEVVSLKPGKIRGMNLHLPGSKVKVDRLIAEADPGYYDALLIPGGFINPDLLRQSSDVLQFVRTMMAAGKPIASICHGPWVLISAGLAANKRLTSWPGIRDDVTNAGGLWEDSAVVRDGALITSRGPMDLPAFNEAVIDLFAEHLPPGRAAEAQERRTPVGRYVVGGLALVVVAALVARRAAA